MPIDNKYGRVTLEHGTIGDDEPVVVFRAKDEVLPKVLMYYHLFCMKIGSPRHHLNLILDALEQVREWQFENHPRIPNSNNYIERVNNPDEETDPQPESETIAQLEDVLDLLAERAAASRRKGKEAEAAGKDHRAAAMRGKAIGLQQGADQIQKVLSQLRGKEDEL